LILSRVRTEKIIFRKISKLQNGSDFENTSSLESLRGFYDFVSTNLSPMMNSESKRYQYPVCDTPVATQHPLSRFQSSARGPGLSPTRSLWEPLRWFSGFSRRKGKIEIVFIQRLDKPDQRPPFSSLRSKRSEASWLRASRTSWCEFLSLSLGHEVCSYSSA